MSRDNQLEQMILERNEFEARTIVLEGELGVMCQAIIHLFNGGWEEDHQMIMEEARRLIDKNKRYIK